MADAEKPSSANRFVLLYALAWAGGTIAYTPLLTILLPAQVADLAGKQVGVGWLAYIVLAGAIAASAGGIAFGYLSDITRNRRGWIAAGLGLACLMLAAVGKAATLAELIFAIICWQLALNMMLGPLAAWAADSVPDGRKGLLGGLMAFAPGLGALSGVLVTQPGLLGETSQLWTVSGLVVICVLPILLFAPANPSMTGNLQAHPPLSQRLAWRGIAGRMWLARLLVQIAEAAMFAYLFFWLASLDPAVTTNQGARLFSLVMLTSAPLALVAGRWSDNAGRPIVPLLACAFGAALGLIGMALATAIGAAGLAYAIFGIASAVFLALHSAQTLRILPRPDRRARDLGLFNLANTIPSLIMPFLALLIVPAGGFPGFFLLLAILSGSAGMLLVGYMGKR